MSETTFSESLRRAAEDEWRAMMRSRFIEDIASDRLGDAAFVRYLRIERGFVGQAVRVFAYALAQAPARADQARLVAVLEGLVGEQERYFDDVFARLGLGEQDVARQPSAAAALAEHALAVAATSGFEEILSTMLAAEWMYLEWCSAAHARRPSRPEPARWIALHAGGEFAEGVAWTRSRLDELGPRLDPRRREACARNFRRMLELEIAFHDCVYD